MLGHLFQNTFQYFQLRTSLKVKNSREIIPMSWYSSEDDFWKEFANKSKRTIFLHLDYFITVYWILIKFWYKFIF